MGKTITATLENTFHNTTAKVRVPVHIATSRYGWSIADLSKRQQRRLRRELCGANDCTCGVVRP